MSTHGPIEEEQRAMMNDLAVALDGFFNGDRKGHDRKIGFVLLTAKFGEIENGRVNYISNGERSDMIAMIEELLTRFKGTHPEEKQNG